MGAGGQAVVLYDASGNVLVGQKTSANSIPVVIASDQAAIVAQLQGYSYNSYSPDPSNIPTTNQTPLAIDAAGRLETHSTQTSDEGSFRDDFPGASLAVALTGTVNFTNGSSVITGTGTSFTSQVVVGQWIKKSTDAETLYVRVGTINSDTTLQTDAVYAGTTAGVAGVISNWNTSTATTGGAITVAASAVSIASGTANGQSSYIQRNGDYGPFTLSIHASVSQRTANQTCFIGFRDAVTGTLARAEVQFTGTVNTQASFVTSQDGTLQTTTFTIPNAGTTATAHLYKIDVSGNQCTLQVDGVVVANHLLHMPSPYQAMNLFCGTTNAAVVTTTTLAIDCVYFYNTDRVQVDDDFQGETLHVEGGAGAGQTPYGNPVLVAGSDGSLVRALKTAIDGALRVASEPNRDLQTFSAAITGLVSAATATDIFTITGSASKTVRISQIIISATSTSSGINAVQLIKRSTSDTAGTSTAPTRVPHDSANAAATAVIAAYTANPTVGTLVGVLKSYKLFTPVAAATAASSPLAIDFGNRAGQGPVLRGAAEQLAINLNGVTVAGGNFNITIEWTEE